MATAWPLSCVPCSVFEVLRSEARVMEGLRSLHIETPYIHDILKLNVQPSDSDYAVDIRNPAISVRFPLTKTKHKPTKILSNKNLHWLIKHWWALPKSKSVHHAEWPISE